MRGWIWTLAAATALVALPSGVAGQEEEEFDPLDYEGCAQFISSGRYDEPMVGSLQSTWRETTSWEGEGNARLGRGPISFGGGGRYSSRSTFWVGSYRMSDGKVRTFDCRTYEEH